MTDKKQPKTPTEQKAKKKLPPKRYRGTRGMGQLLTKQLKNSTQKRGFNEGHIILKWSTIAPDFAARAMPTKLDYKGTLILTVSSASAQQEIMMGAPVLIDRINAFLGHSGVNNIRCQVGVVPPPVRPKSPPIMPSTKAVEQARQTCDNLPNSTLKDLLISLGAQIFNNKT